jgi:flagellar protein FlgJ
VSSIGTDFTTSYLNSLTSQASSLKNSQQASDVEKAASGISKNSSKEELTNAAKTFESYFVEQVIKEVKKTNDELKGDDDTDAYAQQVSDMYMDTTIQTLASDIVDDYGDRFTEDMVKNMQAQYGITDTDRS